VHHLCEHQLVPRDVLDSSNPRIAISKCLQTLR
jgi:hypothetical protein